MRSANPIVTAFILHTKPYQESSLILQVFSLEKGRFSLIAKGIKGKKSAARKAILQPFQLLKIEYAGKSELKTLVSCELAESQTTHALLFQDKTLACAYYANEILLRAIPERHEYQELFQAYLFLLENLLQGKDQSVSLRRFEISLLTVIGIAPDFTHDVKGDLIKADVCYVLVPESGFAIASDLDKDSSYNGDAIIALSSGEIAEAQKQDCQNICRSLLQSVIGIKPLQSRKMWQHINLSKS